jgi:hypothetical protein
MPALSCPCAVLLSLLAVAALVGCGGAYDTPEATFQTIRVAANNKDMRGLFGGLTEESLDTLAGSLVLAFKTPFGKAGMKRSLSAEDADKAEAATTSVCEKYDVTDAKVSDAMSDPLTMFSAGGLKKLADLVEDKVGFIADMWGALEPFGQTSKFSEEFAVQLSGTIKDVKIDGDQATAVLVTTKGEQPLTFRKTPAGWKIHIELGPLGAPPA